MGCAAFPEAKIMTMETERATAVWKCVFILGVGYALYLDSLERMRNEMCENGILRPTV